MSNTITPYNQAGKKKEVEKMFDNIAHSYDFLNHFFSLGIDRLWRKKALRILSEESPSILLDVATGTADLAIAAKAMGIAKEKIIGVDISEGMLEIGRKKIEEKNWTPYIELIRADSENLPFNTGTFDAFTVAFGVRNFENLEKGMSEMLRVLKPGASGLVLEFSRPKKFPLKQTFHIYFKFVMPFFGKIVSKDRHAYSYLQESVQAFPEGNDFISIMERLGYREVRHISLSGGIASIYIGKK
ncbi:MAG: bifunctional demethylmenaquinone methyltransferase/2-methoxy-6-polyprenyl-1,4-benzoquinol methylase UbiE [Crocinitomicaceae bacterium]|nr:bifunctional demethylmenaquinone methyltransferase/2-methoxy-6-polyprenyl-1,4-benzoquinol methylase UbiE [Crocinitomicaceae bacterium]